MNSNNHNPHRRNSSNFNRHNNNHSNRANHNMNHPHNHQKWPNRYPKEYNREYENNFNRRECLVPSGSPKEPNHVHGYPKNPQLSPNSRNNHTHYSNEASGPPNAPRRAAPLHHHQLQPPALNQSFQLPPADRRHLLDRRHGSPPLRVNVCDEGAAAHLGAPTAEGGHLGRAMEFSHGGRRRNGIDVRVSPVHFHAQQHSPPFYRHHRPPPAPLLPVVAGAGVEEYVKSESPSCKRRRLSRSGRHVETAAPPPVAPAPAPMPPVMQPPPPRRSPRQHQSAVAHPQMHHQMPVPIPVAPDAVWSYAAAPRLSLCAAPPAAPPHLHNCHLHGVYATAAGPLAPAPQFAPAPAAAPPATHQGFAAFGPAAGAGLQAVAAGHHHYGHQRMPPQRADPFDLELLNDPHHHPHHHPAAAALHHVPPAAALQMSSAAAASLFLAAAETPTPIELLQQAARARHHGRAASHHHHHHHHHRLGAAPQQVHQAPAAARRWHHSPPLIAAPTGFLLHFFTMFSNSPMSPFSQTGSDSASETTAENYEALLNLAEQLGEVIPRGLSRLEIEQLVSYKFDERTHEGDQTCCVVCMCDFEARQPMRVLPCGHEFHAKCVDKWLRSNRTCPICRGNASDFFTTNE